MQVIEMESELLKNLVSLASLEKILGMQFASGSKRTARSFIGWLCYSTVDRKDLDIL